MTIDNETGEIHTPFLRSAYNYDMNKASNETGLDCPEPTKTQQQFAAEVDINTIVERFGLTGQLPQNVRAPLQGDFTTVYDYQSAMNLIIEAGDAFMQMPAEVRREFDNDPGKFLDFVSDPANRDRAAKLGILRAKEAPPEPQLVRVVQDPQKDPPSGS